MWNNMIGSIFTGMPDSVITVDKFFICTAASLVIGLLLALTHTFRNAAYSKGHIVTIALLPFVVQAVIMVVNGNIGAGVAVAGAFGLVRFRSVQGTARDIVSIFAAVAVGLACGAGYLFIAVALGIVFCLLTLVYELLSLGEGHCKEKYLKITVPENLEYEGMFDDILRTYTKRYELIGTRTTDMGSLYRLTYRVVLREAGKDKAFIDELRTKNGNLEIALNIKGDNEREL